jgi:PglZ domain
LTDPPHLSPGDIEQRLREIFREQHRRSHLVAFHGTGEEIPVDVGDLGRFDVVRVSSELELRKRVPDTLVGDPHCAFLVPFVGHLPLDIGCFFADDGRIFTLGRDLRLKRMFDATEVEPAVRESALARFLLEGPPQRSPMPRFGGRLTFDSLWATWLSVWGLPVEGLSLESLMAWACVSDLGPKFRAEVPQEVREELVHHLVNRTGGPVARVVWASWESGRDRSKPFELGLLFDGMRAPGGDLRDGELLMWRRIKLKELGLVAEAERDQVARELADRAPATFRILHARDASLASKLLVEAEGYVDEDAVRAALVGSSLLPKAWEQRLGALGATLSEVAAKPGPESLELVRRARRDLEAHHLFKDTENKPILERAEMAVRLAAWLVARTDRVEHSTATSYSEAEWLARWYADEGGFIDWARRRARGSDARPFGPGANAIVAAVDEVRVRLDRTFAQALPEWLKAGAPENKIVTIEHAVERFAVRFLAERGDRRLLVLLLDGMAWAQAVEILTSLNGWGLLGWRAVSGEGAAFAPVIASLPTVTEVSRAAFFSGKRTLPGRAEPTDKDPERWAAHAKLRTFVPRGEAPRLLLRAEGHTTSGAVSAEALSLVADTEQRVVGIVINAIDASLKADPQQWMDWTASHIQSLPELLEAAQAAGRAVLLAADHGHIAADHLESAPAATDSKSRWRVWKDPGEPLAEYEVGFEKSIAWAPPGAHGVVLLADDAHRYGGGAHTGEHGGATLAEVVAPTILIGADTLAGRFGAADEDVALRVSAFPEPSWWYPMLSSSPAAREAAPKRRHTPKPARAANQLDLLQPSPAASAPSPAPHPLRALVERSRVFLEAGLPEARKAQVVAAIDFLARRDGEQAPLGAFAVAMGTVATRARGLVEVLAERLNVDGFMLLSYDAPSDLVKLDAAKLKQIYGES